MLSHKGDSLVDITQAVNTSRKGVKSKVVRLHKAEMPVNRTSNMEESGNQLFHTSSEPESVVRSH